MCENNRPIFDESIVLAENAMLKHRPELFDQWDFKKNDELGLDVYKVTKGMDRKMWWVCPKCTSSYDASVSNRMIGRNCSYCRGYKVNNTNSLGDCYPQITKEWHPTKNGDLSPYEITKNNSKKVWWLGECKHEWEAVISSRTSLNTNCPFCSSISLLKGFNDIWTTNPELASLLANHEDGYKYTQMSGASLDWKCIECENTVKNKKVSLINRKGLSCPFCSDGISFPEKFIYHLLTTQKVLFEFQKSFTWSENKRYDFYLPEYDCIIEIHGIQHYENVKFHGHGDGIEKQRENDELKFNNGKENGICHYIVLDARMSTVEHIKKSITSSYLAELISLKNVDYYVIGKKASSSLLFKACVLWNDGYSSTEIGKLIFLSPTTVVTYLKKGAKYDLCDYSYEKAKKRAGITISQSTANTILLLNQDNTIAIEFERVEDAVKFVNKKAPTIKKYCKENRIHLGYKWIYKKDYEKSMLGEGGTKEVVFREISSIKQVMQFDLEMNLIKEWETSRDAASFIGGNHSNISAVCLGKVKTAGGFKWMYREDYEKFLANGGDVNSLVPKYNYTNKKVVQLDLDMRLINEWESMSEASRELKTHASNISAVCKGKAMTALGYKWMYAEDYYKQKEVN